MHPFTDIVVLVYNRPDITELFIQHLFKNTENFRLIFVDNGSNLETKKLLESGKGVKWDLVSLPKNIGVINGRNLAAKRVSADYFVNLDNDQFVREGWLESLFKLINKGYDIAGSEAWLLSEPKDNAQKDYSDYHILSHCEHHDEQFNFINCGGMLITKRLYNKIGLFDSRFSPAYYEDPDLCFRAIRAGFKIGWQPNAIIDHNWHQTLSTQRDFSWKEIHTRSHRAFVDKWHPYYPETMQMKEEDYA